MPTSMTPRTRRSCRGSPPAMGLMTSRALFFRSSVSGSAPGWLAPASPILVCRWPSGTGGNSDPSSSRRADRADEVVADLWRDGGRAVGRGGRTPADQAQGTGPTADRAGDRPGGTVRMDGLASLPVNLSDTNRCSLIGGKYLLPSWAVIPGRIPKSHEVQLATTDAGSSRILSSRDGSRALLLLRPEGPATSGDSMAVAFNTLLPTRDRGPRCVIQLSRTVMEIHEPQSLGVSSTGDSDEGWYRVGEATLGDWLDDLDPAADLGGIPTPLVVKCTTH